MCKNKNKGSIVKKERFFRARVSDEHFEKIEEFIATHNISKTKLFEMLLDKLFNGDIEVKTRKVFDGLEVKK